MPIIASAKKQLRQSIKKNARNTFYKKLYTESRVAFEKAIKAGNLEEAKSLYVNNTESTGNKSGLQSIIDKLVKKNIIHANNASRKKSKFVRMMKSLEQAQLFIIYMREKKKRLNEDIRANIVQVIHDSEGNL